MRRRPGGPRPPAPLTALPLALALTGCTASPPAQDHATVPPTAPSSTSSTEATAGTAAPSAPASTGDSGAVPATGVDCERAEAAKDALDEAIREEMSRLGVRSGDPRAPSVATLVTTLRGKEYYAALVDATSGEPRDDARLALGYYESLATQAGFLDVGSGSAADIAAALARVDALGADPAVVAAQQRVAQEVEAACADDAPGDVPSPTSSATGTGT